MKQIERITHLSLVFVPDPYIDVGLCGQSINLIEKCLNFSRCFDSRYSAENYEASGSDICLLPMKQTERITHLSRAFVPDPNIDVGLCVQSMNLTEKCVNFSRCFHSRYSADNYEASGSDIGGLLRFYLLLMKQK